MSLKHTLLGFLAYGSMTGYDLKKNMDSSTQFFWHAGLSQIYPTLKRMEEEGLIEGFVIPQEGRPDKKLYAVTPAGKAVLMEWLVEPMQALPPKKEPAFLPLFFAGALEKKAILTQLRRHLELHRAQLARYQEETAATVEGVIAETGMAREGVMWKLLQELGEYHEEAIIQWLEHAIQVVEEKIE